MSETATLPTSEVAELFGTDGKTLRKYFRSDTCKVEPVGQGSRYGISEDDIEELRKGFEAWSKGKAAKADKDDEPAADKAAPAAKKTTKKSKKAKSAPTVIEDDEDEPLDDLDPTADDLADLDMELEDLDLD